MEPALARTQAKRRLVGFDGQAGVTDYLALLNALDENERLEAKRGSEVGPSILETVVPSPTNQA